MKQGPECNHLDARILETDPDGAVFCPNCDETVPVWIVLNNHLEALAEASAQMTQVLADVHSRTGELEQLMLAFRIRDLAAKRDASDSVMTTANQGALVAGPKPDAG